MLPTGSVKPAAIAGVIRRVVDSREVVVHVVQCHAPPRGSSSFLSSDDWSVVALRNKLMRRDLFEDFWRSTFAS
jgi:hypothetical protein